MTLEEIQIRGIFVDEMTPGMQASQVSLQSLEKAMTQLDKSGSASMKGVAKAFDDMGGVAGAVTDEIKARVDGAISTFVEFGASQDQVAKGFALLGSASESGSHGVAQTSKALTALIDETEDADLALKNVSKALDLAAATGMKAEDAARTLGQTLSGKTSKVMTALVGETEDADLALKNVSKAFDLAAATGMKAEDAGRALGSDPVREH